MLVIQVQELWVNVRNKNYKIGTSKIHKLEHLDSNCKLLRMNLGTHNIMYICIGSKLKYFNLIEVNLVKIQDEIRLFVNV